MTIEGSRFTPDTLTVRVGDSVVWVNKDLFPHTATSSGARFDSQAIAPEQSWTYKVTTEGSFAYVCTFHPTMKGTITATAR